MVGVLSTVLKPWTIPGRVTEWFVSSVKKAWDMLPKPKSFLGKAIVYPLYVWIAIPGTVPLSLYWLADAVGYGPQVREWVENTTLLVSGLFTIALDLFGKILFWILTGALSALIG